VAAISAQLSGQSPAKSQPALEQSLIEYFPVSESTGNVDDANVEGIPEEALELLHDLVQPWSTRSVFGQLIDLTRREQSQEATFSTLSTEDRQTPVSKSLAVETS
jgi:hypothetical protein